MKYVYFAICLCMLFASLSIPVSTYASPLDYETWDDVRWGGVVAQELDNSCGLASLLTIMQGHFGDMRYNEKTLLKEYFENADESDIAQAMSKGLSLLELEHLAKSIDYKVVKKAFTIDDLERIVSFVPVLVYLEVGTLRHFAVLRGMNLHTVLLGDPSRGNVEYSREEFLEEWKTPDGYPPQTGAALVIVRPGIDAVQNFLREPELHYPPSFLTLRQEITLR